MKKILLMLSAFMCISFANCQELPIQYDEYFFLYINRPKIFAQHNLDQIDEILNYNQLKYNKRHISYLMGAKDAYLNMIKFLDESKEIIK